MEERLEAPSVVSNPLPASADPRGLSAVHTRHLAAPDRVIHHAVPVTFEHDDCAPFARMLALAQHLCGEIRAPHGAWIHRPSPPIRFRDELLPSVSAVRAVCDGLSRPPCGPPCGSTRSTSPMHSTDFCFPLLSTTSTRATFVPSISSRLAPRPLAPGLHPGRRRLGDLTVQDVRSASTGSPGLDARRFLPRAPGATEPLASLSLPRGPRPACAKRESAEAAETVTCRRSVKIRQPRRSEMPSIASRPAPCAGRTHSRKRSREVSASMRVPVSLHPRLRTFVRWSCELGARPRTQSRSGEKDCVRFSAPATVWRLLQQRQRRASTTSSVRSSLASAGGPSLGWPLPMRWPSLSARSSRSVRFASAPPLPRKGGQRATFAPSTPPPGQYKSAGRWGAEGHRSS